MKKFLLIILSFLIVTVVCGCTYNPSEGGKGTEGDKPPVTDDNPKDDSPFTVTLVDEDGEEFGVYREDGTTALFTSKEDKSVVEVPFNTHGVARAEGLDGDYTVTINSLDGKYAYNPNIYTATNDNKNITITVYRLLDYTGKGTGWYPGEVLNLPKAGGIYRIPVNSLSHEVYCQYRLPTQGEYYIESLADITANEINPRMEVYEANGSWVAENPKQSINYTDDAPCSGFTKNFRYKISAYSSTFVCAFKLTCDSRVEYPAYVDLYVVRAADYAFGDDVIYPLYLPEENFKQTPDYNKSFNYIANDDPNGVLRGERVRLNEADGYYHMLDSDGKMTDVLLYAKLDGDIISPNGVSLINFQDKPDPNVGNTPGGGGDDETVNNRGVNLYFSGWNYTFMIQGYDGLVATNYSDARNYADKKSYINYVNRDGVYAVTRELKDFLQAYSIYQRFFYDGLGGAEQLGYNSSDANQWLFACGYYA